MANPNQSPARKPADRYLASYQKLSLFPFLAALISLFSTFLLYSNSDYGLNIAFFLIRFLRNNGLELVWLWVIGIGIAFAFLFASAYAAKGKWWLLIICFVLFAADLGLGLSMIPSLDNIAIWLGVAVHAIFLFTTGFALFMAYLTTKELKKEKN